MKKVLIVFIFYILSFKFCVFPTFAFSIWDIFPPIKMVNKPLYGNPPATVVEEIGPQGVTNSTYTNLLKDPETYRCKDSIEVSGSWEADKDKIYDSNGNVVGVDYVYPYNANNLDGGHDYEKKSNNYPRFLQAKINRHVPDPDTQVNATDFRSLDSDGYGFLDKSLSDQTRKYIQGKALEEMFKTLTLDDSNYADVQRAWDCGGSMVAMADGINRSTTCRPVTVGEIAYYYYKNKDYHTDPLLFEDAVTMTPKAYPDVIKNYEAYYSKHNHNSIKFLSDANYAILRDQLPMKALGVSNQKIILTNYNSVASQWPNFEPGDPEEVKQNRGNIFEATGFTYLTNHVSSITAPRDFAKPFDCKDVEIKGAVSIDTPNPISMIAYIKGLVRVVTDQPKWNFSYQNDVVFLTEKNDVDGATNISNDFAFILPAGNPEAEKIYKKLQDTPATSKVDKEAPPDVGNQAEQVNLVMTKYLYPQSWQDKYKF